MSVALAFPDKVARASDQMTPSEWAVLALLNEEPTHGFAIARALDPDGDIGKVWSLRRPRVYYAIEALTDRGFARPVATVASPTGPARTMLRITPSGARALEGWLAEPVDHVRDARSLLLLKLLFLERGDRDPRPLLRVQRALFERIADHLQGAVEDAQGFDRTLLRWRLENAAAAIRFIDAVSERPDRPTPTARRS
jgi:DNA-binding PadR family transcriptional regulator